MRHLRFAGCLGLAVGLVGLIVLSAWVLLDFSLPKVVRIPVGSTTQYQDGQAPRYFAGEGTPFYVLGLGGELIALSARSERITRCIIRWQAPMDRFVDPCLGTRFSRDGAYQRGGPPQEMHRLPLQVKNDQVWVEVGYR